MRLDQDCRQGYDALFPSTKLLYSLTRNSNNQPEAGFIPQRRSKMAKRRKRPLPITPARKKKVYFLTLPGGM
jgi:hypothetical protein